ncbi:unnamed protein product [Chrysoparadoxa australica]
MLLLLFCLLVLGFSGAAAEESLNDWPVIAVVAQDLRFYQESSIFGEDVPEGQYIAASYVEWIESAGGQVLPVPYDISHEYVDEILASCNGLLLPGGMGDISEGWDYGLKEIMRMNKSGKFFPLWGTCLGFEWMVQAYSDADADAILEGDLDSMNYTLALDFEVVPEGYASEEEGQAEHKEDAENAENGDASGSRASRMFGPDALPLELFKKLGKQRLAFNAHEKGVDTAAWWADEALCSAFRVLSVNKDRQGRPFVSSIEGRSGMPLYGVQWHPEKNMAEWGVKDDKPYSVIDHSPEGIAVSWHLAMFFVSEARKNTNVFPLGETDALIYGDPVTTISQPVFCESYFFAPDFLFWPYDR